MFGFGSLDFGDTGPLLSPPIVAGTIGITKPAAAALIYSSIAALSVKGKYAAYLSIALCNASTGASFKPVIPMFLATLRRTFCVGNAIFSRAPRPIFNPK